MLVLYISHSSNEADQVVGVIIYSAVSMDTWAA